MPIAERRGDARRPKRAQALERGTNTWSTYRIFKAGDVALPAGDHRLEVGLMGPLREALFDLRAIVLKPR